MKKKLDLNLNEISEKDLKNINGGVVKIMVAEGFMDGIKGNEHLWILGFKVF